MRAETKASAYEWLKKAGVHQLPEEHPDRRKAFSEWVVWASRRPAHDPFKDMAENDPNRLPAPAGWTRLGG